MEKRALGNTGLEVTLLGYGAIPIGDRELSEEAVERTINTVLDSGVNFVDTAPDYWDSEERIGKYISHRRSEYYLATKCGCDITESGEPLGHIWTKEKLISNLELSLRRMRTDYVDIWQIHNAYVDDVDQGELLAVMEEVKRSGKVRHISVSSHLPHVRTFIERGDFETYQITYSALDRAHEMVIGEASASGCGVIVRGYVGSVGSKTRRPKRLELWKKANLDELLGEGESRFQFLLRFTISHKGISTTIVGTSNADHLAENLASIEAGPLPNATYEEAKRRLDAAGESPKTA